jgi:hypothetical protein
MKWVTGFAALRSLTPTMLSILDGRRDFHISICRGLCAEYYDKRAGRIMIRDFRIHYFGEHRYQYTPENPQCFFETSTLATAFIPLRRARTVEFAEQSF